MYDDFLSLNYEGKLQIINTLSKVEKLEKLLKMEQQTDIQQIILQRIIDINSHATILKVLRSSKKNSKSKIEMLHQITDQELLINIILEEFQTDTIYYHINTGIDPDKLFKILNNIDNLSILQGISTYKYLNNKEKSKLIKDLLDNNTEWELILELIRKLPSPELQKMFLGFMPSIEILNEILRDEIDNPELVSESIELLNNSMNEKEYILYLTSIVFSSKYRTYNRIACLRKLVKIMTNTELSFLLKKLLSTGHLSHMLYMDLISILRQFELLEEFFFSTPIWSNKQNIIESKEFIEFAPRIIFENLDYFFSKSALSLLLHTKSYNDDLLHDIALKTQYAKIVRTALQNIKTKKKLLELRLSLPSQFQPILTEIIRKFIKELEK